MVRRLRVLLLAVLLGGLGWVLLVALWLLLRFVLGLFLGFLLGFLLLYNYVVDLVKVDLINLILSLFTHGGVLLI